MVLVPGEDAAVDAALVRQDEKPVPGLKAGLQGGFNARDELDLLLPTGVVVVADQVAVAVEEKGGMAGHRPQPT